MTRMIIDWKSLSDDALNGIVEEFVTREGTEYGDAEVALATKVRQVREQVTRGEAVIVWDSALESASIMPSSSIDLGDNERGDA